MTDGDVKLEGEAASENTSSSLLVRVKARDEGAWERFVHLYEPLVHHWCRRYGLQEADAADVGQDVFRTVAGSIADFRHEQKGDTFRGWLRTVTRSRVLDHLRRKPRAALGVGGSDALERLAELPDHQAEPETSDEGDKLILVRRAMDMVLGGCKEQTRQAFLRVVIAGGHPADVAQDLGMTVNAVYLVKSHLLRKIREEFAEIVDL